MGSRPAANPRYLKSGQLASFFWVVKTNFVPTASVICGVKTETQDLNTWKPMKNLSRHTDSNK
jgi:hypothetical protein